MRDSDLGLSSYLASPIFVSDFGCHVHPLREPLLHLLLNQRPLTLEGCGPALARRAVAKDSLPQNR
jgi:hypothetical protein